MGWHDVSEALDRKLALVHSIGYLLSRDKLVLRLVRTIASTPEEKAVGDVMLIPTDWVQRVRKLYR